MYSDRIAIHYTPPSNVQLTDEETGLLGTLTSEKEPRRIADTACGALTEPRACLRLPHCGWCTTTQSCLPDGLPLGRPFDYLGLCSRCSYFAEPHWPAVHRGATLADACLFKAGCGLCAKEEGDDTADCVEGDNDGQIGVWSPCRNWVAPKQTVGQIRGAAMPIPLERKSEL